METSLGSSYRAPSEETPDVLPASQYLQERLLERRARNIRPKRLRQSDFGPRIGRDDDIFVNEAESSRNAPVRMFDSSPLVAGARNAADASDNGRRRGLGAKGMDEHMDRLTKENFALKLELDHRREHTAKLQEKIDAMRAQAERAEHLQEEHTELLRINSQLVEELEKRDKAVEEAMDIICDLEDKVADMEERSSVTRPSTANADSGYAGTETQEQGPPSSPPELIKAPKTPQVQCDEPPAATSAATNRLVNAVNGKTPARTRREPTVLSQKKQSTHALRSVYLEATQSLHPVKSFNSLLTRQETRSEDGADVPNSPRLSVLSESSFPSMYSPKKGISPERYAWEDDDEPTEIAHGPSPHLRQDSIKRVSQWMNERDLTEQTPSKSNKITPPLLQQPDMYMPSSAAKRSSDEQKYQSLGNALSTGPEAAIPNSNEASQPVEYIKPFPIRTARQLPKSSKPMSFGGPMFGEPLLPPTPESASTRMLRTSRSSISDEKSLLDTTPAAVRGFDALEPGVRTAPRQMRSSVELKDAYQSYIQHREENALGLSTSNKIDDDLHADIVHRDLSMEYDGFPDGGSILMGTPSRFLKHGKPPGVSMALDGYDDSPTEARMPPFTRRQTSSEATISPRKPHFNRAETSPPAAYAQGGNVTTNGFHYSTGSITSPRSYHSGSSSNKTLMQADDRTVSPEFYRMNPRTTSAVTSPQRSRTSPSPARTLGQKAQGLLRRLSNSQGDRTSDREKSPLPTLTSAPSSAYVNNVPKEVRRPGTSYSGGEPTAQQLPPVPRTVDSGKRPSMQTRNNTAPAPVVPARPLSASIPDHTPSFESPFRRSNGAKKDPETPTFQPDGATGFVEGTGFGMRGLISRRRGSIKDAVASAARRPWR